MAVRIRATGEILCAAMHPEKAGDTYIDDELHYVLSVERKVLVTEPVELHSASGQWWWSGQAPPTVDPFYGNHALPRQPPESRSSPESRSTCPTEQK